MKYRSFFVPIIVTALIFLGLLTFLPILGKPLISLVQKKDTRWSIIMLEEARDLVQFNTVQHVYKVVFPYDFMARGMDLQTILSRFPPVRGKRPALGDILYILENYESSLSSSEKLFLEAARLCNDMGLKYEKPQHQFLIATVVVEAGINFAGTVFDRLEQATEIEKSAVLTEDTEQNKKISLHFPALAISDIRMEDRNSGPASQQYPDVVLKPGAWKKVADFIDRYYQAEAVNQGILSDAELNARAFLTEFFESAGYDEVVLSFGN